MLNEILRWDGKRWAKASTPSRSDGRPVESFLNAVTCASPTSCWGVGYYTMNGASYLNEALHWNGNSWVSVRTPNPGSRRLNQLYGVSCASPRQCWAVGEQNYRNEVMRWNGSRWLAVAVPTPSAKHHGSGLAGVTCPAPSNCWALGNISSPGPTQPTRNEMLHWNGAKWLRARPPSIGDQSSSSAVSCVSTRGCWAVGSLTDDEGTSFNIVLHWNGARWKRVHVPRHGSLAGISCTSMSACWAVGGTSSPKTTISRNEALRWNGTKWSSAQIPSPTRSNNDSSSLTGISCTSSDNCWAVGDIGNLATRSRNEALHWNGKRWSRD